MEKLIILQSPWSQVITSGNSVACTDNATGFTVENHYWRAFDMNTFTGGQQYDVVCNLWS